MGRKYKVIAEGAFNQIKDIIPAIAFVGHDRSKRLRATIEIEELSEVKKK